MLPFSSKHITTILFSPFRIFANIWAVKIFLIGFITVNFLMYPLQGSPKRPTIAKNHIADINQEEAETLLKALREYRLSGDFIFTFNLIHYPYREDEITLSGTLYGTADENGPILRIHLKQVNGENDRLLLKNGTSPRSWKKTKNEVKELKGAELLVPVSENFVYTPFDFQMPFIHWPKFSYTGSKRVKGRPTYIFQMIPPDSTQEIQPDLKFIEIALDANYNAMVRVNMVSQNDKTFKQIEILSLKKTQGQYIPKIVDLLNKENRSKTRFKVAGAALNLNLPKSLFIPENLNKPLPFIQGAEFEEF